MKRRSVALVFFSGCIAVPCAALAQTSIAKGVQQADTLPRLPGPSGPFGIGRVGYDWIDSSRRDQDSTGSQAHRELMVYFWYPSSHKPAETRGPYLPGSQQMDAMPEIQSRMRDAFGKNWPSIVSEAIFSHAAEHAPVGKNPRQFPVIVFSHGAGSSLFLSDRRIGEPWIRGCGCRTHLCLQGGLVPGRKSHPSTRRVSAGWAFFRREIQVDGDADIGRNQ